MEYNFLSFLFLTSKCKLTITSMINFSYLCILWRAIIRLQALSSSFFGALWLRGGLASTAGLNKWPTLSLLLDVRCQAHWHLFRGKGGGWEWGGGWVEDPAVAEKKKKKKEDRYKKGKFCTRCIEWLPTWQKLCKESQKRQRECTLTPFTCRWYQIGAGLCSLSLDRNHTERCGNPLT